jgi:hypothetical protein
MDSTLQRGGKFRQGCETVRRKRCSFIPEPAAQTKKRGRSRVFIKNDLVLGFVDDLVGPIHGIMERSCSPMISIP